VYLSFWQPELAPGKRNFRVMLVNDEYREASGTLTISLAGKEAQKPFAVGALGQTTLYIDLDVSNTPGDFLLQAKADAVKGQPTLSRRKVAIKAPAGK